MEEPPEAVLDFLRRLGVAMCRAGDSADRVTIILDDVAQAYAAHGVAGARPWWHPAVPSLPPTHPLRARIGHSGGMPNRLASATSPYLLQHADNPVDWWEWGDEAFEVARQRNVPILLSVGYAACHWCHVMAHESFEDEDTAAYLNEHYVSIKVDREERPDVDAVYMQATVAMTGQGGWPMTCVLDHEGSPFFAGTYFPDRPRHGQPSFRQLLEAIDDAWTNRFDEVVAASDADPRGAWAGRSALEEESPSTRRRSMPP